MEINMNVISKITTALIVMLTLSSCWNENDSKVDLTLNNSLILLSKINELFDPSSTKISTELVPCTLSGGTKTECFSVTVTSLQTEHKTGPWCPRNINDDADKAGIWMYEGKAIDADGEFIENLATYYDDNQWQLFNPNTGDIRVTDSKESCAAAARPDVDIQYQNYCVECLPSYVEDQKEITYLIPAHPIYNGKSQRGGPHSGLGIAFNGVKFDASAPIHAILGAHTLAPFDDCGGHVNLHVGYHYHAVTGCTKEAASIETHAPSIGYSMDGFMIHTRLNLDDSEPVDLDVCGGHVSENIGYHYHANKPGENKIIGCFQAEQGCAVEGDNSSCQMTGRRPPPPQRRQDGQQDRE